MEISPRYILGFILKVKTNITINMKCYIKICDAETDHFHFPFHKFMRFASASMLLSISGDLKPHNMSKKKLSLLEEYD